MLLDCTYVKQRALEGGGSHAMSGQTDYTRLSATMVGLKKGQLMTPYECLSPEAKAFVDEWAAELPPVIFRKQVKWFLGGAISNKNLANLDSAGEGPPNNCKVKIGREMAYRTQGLLAWLVRSRGFKRLKEVQGVDGTISVAG